MTKDEAEKAELRAQRNQAMDMLAAANGVIAELRAALEAALREKDERDSLSS